MSLLFPIPLLAVQCPPPQRDPFGEALGLVFDRVGVFEDHDRVELAGVGEGFLELVADLVFVEVDADGGGVGLAAVDVVAAEEGGARGLIAPGRH